MILGISGKKQSGKSTLATIIQYHTQMKDFGYTTWEEFERIYNNKKDYGNIWFWKPKMFAEKLKQIVCLLIGCTMEQLEDQAFKEKPLGQEWNRYIIQWYGPSDMYSSYDEAFNSELFAKLKNTPKSVVAKQLTPRLLLQLLGTECGRKLIHPNIWVNALMSDYRVSDQDAIALNVAGHQEFPQNYYPNWLVTDVRFLNEAKAIKDRGGLIFRIERPDIVSNDKHESEVALDNYQNFDEWIVNDTIEKLIEDTKQILINHKIINNG